MKGPYRIAVRPDWNDESAFELPDFDVPEDAPARTKDGEPWTRWGGYGSYSGWYAIGSREPEVSARPTFWQAVFHVACKVTGGNLDQAHCCGKGVMSLGGLGVTLRSGFAQILLHECLLTNPERFVEVMAPLLYETGVYTKMCDKSPSGVALCDHKGHPVLTEEAMREIVMLGSDGLKWTRRQKDRARLWVTCCSKLLRDARMDEAQAAFAEEMMPALLTERTREQMRWPRHGMRDAWQYTHEQQALWALTLILALEDDEQTEHLVLDCVRHEPRDAPGDLNGMRVKVPTDSTYTGTFQTRFLGALPQLEELFRINLKGGDT
jgi:hypothetical protein